MYTNRLKEKFYQLNPCFDITGGLKIT
jgi:hypothetical protein